MKGRERERERESLPGLRREMRDDSLANSFVVSFSDLVRIYYDTRCQDFAYVFDPFTCIDSGGTFFSISYYGV